MRKNSKTALRTELKYRLHKMYKQGRGNSKRDAKTKSGGASPYIHSPVTLKTYLQQVEQYCDWVSANVSERPTLDDAAKNVQAYIDSHPEWSAWSQQTARSAIGKALGVDPTTLAKCDTRHAANITRGRSSNPSSAAAAARCADDLAICECVGVRHGKEAKQVTPANCHWRGGHITSVSLVGKGGRPREATVLPGRGRDLLEARCNAAQKQNTKLLGDMNNANVHGARAKYAAGIYAKGMAEGRGNGQMYTPRGMGKKYDKGVLDYVNANLGHGAGRYDTAVHNYLSYGED